MKRGHTAAHLAWMLVACQPFSAELGDALGAQPQALRVVHFEIQQQPLHVTDGHFATARCQAIRIEVHRGTAAGVCGSASEVRRWGGTGWVACNACGRKGTYMRDRTS